MQRQLQADRDDFSKLLEATCAFATQVLSGIDNTRVACAASAPKLTALPAAGIGTDETLELFIDSVAPFLSASAGARYLGFVVGGGTPAAVVGDWLATVFDQNPISRLDGSATLRLERDTIGMLRDLFGLPDAFAGSFVSGATMSNFVGLALAREWVGREHGVRVCEEGITGLPRFSILAASPHSSACKALSMLGLGRGAWQQVSCRADSEAMELPALEELLKDRAEKQVVVASAGTVNTGAFDDFRELAQLKQRYGFWLHVDAAFGGFASLSPEFQPNLEGWECADSICIDLHKWLNVPYDSAVVFTRHRDLQADVFRNFSAYLEPPAEDCEPIHLVPENSHRWRALPAWFSLLAYGREGHREIIERDCALARALGERIERSRWFKLLAPVQLNIVCFALRHASDLQQFVTTVRDDGATFVTPTVLHGRPAVRAAFSNWRTSDDDLELIWNGLVAAAQAVQ